MNNRFIHFRTRSEFDALLRGGNIPAKSIVFIDEGNLIYTHGTFYGGSNTGVTQEQLNVLNLYLEELGARIGELENADEGLSNILITNPQDGDIIVYDNNLHKWINKRDNYVTIDGSQNITGAKTFTNPISIYDRNDGNAQIRWSDGTLVIDTNGKGLKTDGYIYGGAFYKTGDDWLLGHSRRDYLLRADGDVIYIGELVSANPTEPTDPTDPTSGGNGGSNDPTTTDSNTVYYGFGGSSISSVSGLQSKTLSSLGGESFTSTGQDYWWIVIPSSWTLDLAKVTMGSLPMRMNSTSTSVTVNNNQYKAYRSLADYDYATQTITIIQ